MNKLYIICKALCVSLVLFVSTPASADNAAGLLQRAQELVNAGEHEAAFLLLDKTEARFATHLAYTYLHGLTALESGRAGVAVLSFQRAVRLQPNFAGARLELGRAYHASGETDLAQREFEQLLLLNPPANVVRVIEKYLVAGKQQQKRYTASIAASLSAIAGYSSNANSGLRRETLFGITLDEQTQRTESAFTGGKLAASGRLPLLSGLELSAGLDGSVRRFDDASEVNSEGYGGQLGLSFTTQRSLVSARLSSSNRDIGNDLDYQSQRAGVSALRQLGSQWLLNSGISYGRLRFSEQLSNRDVNQRELNLGLTRFFNSGWVKSVGLVALSGRDKRPTNIQAGEDWSRRLSGGKLLLNAELSPKWTMAMSYANIRARFDQAFALVAESRRDQLQISNATLTRERLLCGKCSFTLSLGYIDQDSNNPRFAFDGASLGVSMERSF